MIGMTISHFRILEKLGEGGMGIVYKAQDTRLDRFVALKFLPSHIARSEQERQRFVQEARSASALNHPNVCTIYGIGEADGEQFIEMEFVDGVTLRERIAASPPMEMMRVVDVALQIGEALQEAHGKGIVHRDIKAENIMVDARDRIKVMDFGLAKLKGSLKLTRTSSTIGTLAYMSPEQIQGKEADPRSDLFSFGVVLFEMVTGRMPFRGEHEAAVMYSIVNEPPEDPARYRPDTPEAMRSILVKALEKDPEDRYQSMTDLLVDLRRLKKDSTRVVRPPEFRPAAGPASVGRKFPSFLTAAAFRHRIVAIAVLAAVVAGIVLLSGPLRSLVSGPDRTVIVVLPFENLGPSDKQYFVDGMTEEVTSRLSGLSGLKVIARSSAMQYKNSPKSLKQIGAELGVSFVLQGTVRWETAGGTTNVRVNPTLIRVDDETQVWAVSVESVLSSAFKLQSDIASRVAAAMDVVTGQDERSSLTRALTNDPEAYDLYLRGAEFSSRIAREELDVAITLLGRAVARDPSFAAAYAKLAKVHAAYYWFFFDRSEARVRLAQENARLAVRLAPELSEAHEAMGWAYYHTQLDYANALREFDLALKYRPSNSTVHYGIAAVKRRQGDMPGSIESFARAIEENPRAYDLIRQMGESQTLARRYAEADRTYQRALDLAPEAMSIYWDRFRSTVLERGDLERAEAILADAKRYGKAEEMKYIPEFSEFLLAVYRRDFVRAESLVTAFPEEEFFTNQFTFKTRTLLHARLAQYRGRTEISKRLFTEAAADLKRRITASPADERLYSAYGIALAGMGKMQEAVEAGRRAVELLPVEKEAWRGATRLEELAEIYAMVGRHDEAFDIVERLFRLPAEFSPQSVRLDPVWDPLRTRPRYRTIMGER